MSGPVIGRDEHRHLTGCLTEHLTKVWPRPDAVAALTSGLTTSDPAQPRHAQEVSEPGQRDRCCRQIADKYVRGPVAISGDRASDLRFFW